MGNSKKEYTAAELAAVYGFIRNRKNDQKTCSFRIQIDGQTVVKRTYDLDLFFRHLDFIYPTSREISIRVYGRFRPVETFEFSLCGNDVSAAAYENAQKANIDLFSQLLDKDIEISGLREQVARLELKKKTGDPLENIHRPGPVEIFDLGEYTMMIFTKEKANKVLDLFENQLRESMSIAAKFRKAVAGFFTKKS